jgi:hypothetical protein
VGRERRDQNNENCYLTKSGHLFPFSC